MMAGACRKEPKSLPCKTGKTTGSHLHSSVYHKVQAAASIQVHDHSSLWELHAILGRYMGTSG